MNPLFTREPVAVPRDRLPDTGMDPELAYQLVHDELMLEGNARRRCWASPPTAATRR